MALFRRSRRSSAIDDRDALAAFMDERAQAFARAAVEDYSRARAQQDAEILFADPAFAGMIEKACAEAYPIALALIGEMVEDVLAPHAHDRPAQLQSLVAVMQRAFDRRGAPPAVALSAWSAARQAAAGWLGEAIAHVRLSASKTAPKPIDAIVDPFAPQMLALMPIHDNLGRDDYPLLRATLRAALADAHARFTKAVDAATLAKALMANG